ncbi:MAG: SpoIIE family protein phosphatase [Candidatus Aminicenantes bacterium]|nr:SpoIIE family protein phosphatase [Candidatus Aminicenantes bacterium]
MKRRGIAFKLILFIMTGITLIFSLIFGYNYLYSRRILLKNVEDNARNLALATTNRIETILRSMEVATTNLSTFLQQSAYDDKQRLLGLIRSFVECNPEIYGSTIAFEPYAYDQNSLYFSPYFYKSEGETKFTYIGGEGYHYFYWTWYQLPKELNRPVWNEPYYDEGAGNIIMSTFSVPLYKIFSGEKEFLGVLTADISLEWLQEIVSSIKIFESGYGFLISRNGTVVTHPFKDLIMHETIFSVAEAREDAHLREIGREMIRGESGFVPFTSIVTEHKCWMAYCPVPSTGWSLAVIYPQDELMADVVNMNRTIFLLFLVGLFLLLGVIVFNARSITKPLRMLARATRVISTGNLDAEFPQIKSKDEVGNLSESFVYMQNSLKRYIQDLTETTAAKERIESELKIAREIQMSIIPKIFPPFPDRPEFDIFACIEPAKEVGGDLYDFFFIDDDHICFMIGDVSGKGVPASLFMAVTKTLFKANTGEGIRPDEILVRLNNELSRDNDSCMFVTIFCGILNTKTGEVLYSSAGHNPPLFLCRDKEAEYLGTPGGIAVGALEGLSFKTERLVLHPGECLFMYTDGVTEAANLRDELFSEKKLRDDLSPLRDRPIKDIVSSLMEKIEDFSQGAPQADDITVMILKYFGGA